MKKIWDNPLYRFFILGIGMYLIWFSVYQFAIQPTQAINIAVSKNIVYSAEWLLNIIGIQSYIDIESDHVVIGVSGAYPSGVWIGEPCNGIKLFGLFIVFILAYPGKWLNKLWFIPLGLFIIHFVNIIRVMALMWINYKNPAALDFNHNYTFTILVYSVIVILWLVWIKKYGNIKKV